MDYPDLSIAGHFIGNETVLDMLRARGYEIESVGRDEVLDLGWVDYLTVVGVWSLFINIMIFNIMHFYYIYVVFNMNSKTIEKLRIPDSSIIRKGLGKVIGFC